MTQMTMHIVTDTMTNIAHGANHDDTGAGGQDARVVKSDMVTDPSINVLFNHPISQPAAIDGVTIVAE